MSDLTRDRVVALGKKADAVISFVGFALQTRDGEDASKGQLRCFRMVAKLGIGGTSPVMALQAKNVDPSGGGEKEGMKEGANEGELSTYKV
jgi:hypothetical protein